MLPSFYGTAGTGAYGAPLLSSSRARPGRRAPPGGGGPGAALAAVTLLALGLLALGARPGGGAAAGGAAGASSLGRKAAAGAARARRGAPAARAFPAAHLDTLVLVACHSVYTGLDFHAAGDRSSWFLLDYQKEAEGQVDSFVDHIRRGVSAAAADPGAMLLFSGGATRRAAGPRAEAAGYWMVAEAAAWYGAPEVRARAFTEERARDSLENLLFGLCRFWELAGRHPKSITVVGYELKRDRFTDLHRAAARYPARAFQYLGTPAALGPGAAEGEAAAAAAFEADPYGCAGALAEKRRARDPFAVGGYEGGAACPPLAALLAHCGPGVFAGPLPWDDAPRGGGGGGGGGL